MRLERNLLCQRLIYSFKVCFGLFWAVKGKLMRDHDIISSQLHFKTIKCK